MGNPGIMIAAVKSGSGKTTITCAFLRQLKERGRHPVSFKCGPDYIDPMFHETVLKIPSKNLDTFFSEASQIEALYEMEQPGHDISVLEGVMGLYDGLGGIREEADNTGKNAGCGKCGSAGEKGNTIVIFFQGKPP